MAIHAAILGGGVVLAGPAVAQPAFIEQQPISTTALTARSVFAVDVDGDGDVDVVSASEFDNKVAWYENDGAQSFTLHTISASALFAKSVFAADVDGDGDLDVLSASNGDNKIAWYENDGDQIFTLHTISNVADDPISVFAADMDGDGDIDVLSASTGDNKFAWYENDGGQSFTLHTINTSVLWPLSVFATDVDGDGDTDMLGASRDDNTIAWYENDGGQNFTLHTITESALGAHSVFATDVDGDGDTDVLGASWFGDTIAWYENDGAQVFTEHTISAAASLARGVSAADFDGDGDVDVLSASQGDNKIAWYENDGDEAFTLRTISVAAVGENSAFAADVDGDGDVDVLSASSANDKIAWYRNDLIEATPPFSTQLVISTANTNAQTVFSADLDGDGDHDLVSGGNILAWHKNDGNQSFPTPATVAGATAVQSVYVDDVDRDGDPDLVTASTGGAPDKVAWHENDGTADPTFTLHTIADTANGARWARSADLDGDGDVDVASASYTDDKIAWYENDGSQGFTEHTIVFDTAGGANGANSVEIADVDGDGDLDLIGGAYFDGVAWYENNGLTDPTFDIRVVVAGKRVTSVAWGDIDADGDVDLASASQMDDTIAWYENDGMDDPTFTLHTISTLADAARAVIVADLDRDGDIDLASVSRLDDTVAWYENDGAENFTTRTLSTAADDVRGMAAADLDGDGDVDLLSASLGDDKVAWHENLLAHREAAFAPAATVDSGVLVLSVDTADVDSDGDLDLLAGSRSDQEVKWYRNDGDGAFSPFVVGATTGLARAVGSDDVDRDGDVDVLAGNDDNLIWYQNDGAENFTPRTVATNGARSVVSGDIDGDGDVDLGRSGSNVAWYENQGAENFATESFVGGGRPSVELSDVDRDGDLDFVAASDGFGGAVYWHDNLGTGSFFQRTVTEATTRPFRATSADVDRDGDIDILATDFDEDKIVWHQNDGAQTFTPRTVSTTAIGAYGMAADDLDGDGDIDVLAALNTGDSVAWYENDGAQGFSTQTISSSVNNAYSVTAADVDGDGDLDVVSGGSGEVELFDNCGGNFSVDVSDVAPGVLGDGQQDALLRLQVSHQGRIGDDTLELVSWGFRFEDGLGQALSTPQFDALVASLDIYRDAGDPSFDPLDVLVSTLPGGANLKDGVQVLHFTAGDGEAQVAVGAQKDYFLAVTLEADASQQPQTQIRAVQLGSGADRPKAKARVLDAAYRSSCSADVTSSTVTATAPGVTVDPTVGLTTTETGGADTFSVVLDTEPSANVTIGVSSSDTSEGTVDQAILTFTPANWDFAQTVTVTGVNDDIDDGNVGYTVQLVGLMSGDPDYSGLDPADVAVTNSDDDLADIIVDLTPLATTEAGGSDLFTVVLNSEPLFDVTIPVSSSDTSEGGVDQASLTFTPANWDTAQTVTVTGVNDDIDDGDVGYSAVLGAATSADGEYDGITPDNVPATNSDDDTAGISVDTIPLTTTEAGGSDQFTVVLDSEPLADVAVPVSSSDTSEGTVDQASLSFTPGNWNTAQTVTVTGVDDAVADGDVGYNVQLDLATSTDLNYNGIDPTDVAATNSDDEPPTELIFADGFED